MNAARIMAGVRTYVYPSQVGERARAQMVIIW